MTRSRILISLLVLAGLGVAVPAIDAAPTCSIGWDGGAGTDQWKDAGNWSTDAVPGSGDDVCVDQPAGGTVVISGISPTVKSIQGAQTLKLESGTLNVTDDTDATLANLTQTGGNLTGNGRLTVSGTFDWTGGETNGGGLTRVTGTTTIHGNVAVPFDRHIEIMGGSWTSGEIWARNRSLLIVKGTFEVSSEAGEMVFANWDNGTPATVRTDSGGQIVKTTGTGTTHIGWAIENDGVVSVTSGTLNFKGGGGDGTGHFQSPGGEIKLSGGTFTQGGGTYDGIEIAGGRVNVPADGLFSGGDLKMSGGAIGSAGTLRTTGLFELTGGVMDGPGLTESTGTTKIAGNVSFEFDRRFATNDGEWTSGELWSRNRVQWTNSGTFDMRSTAGNMVFANWDNTTPPTIRNTGTILRTAGDGDTTVGWAIENDGVVRAEAGRLVFRGGGGESNGSFESTTGRTVLAGGTFTAGNGTHKGFEVADSGRLNIVDGATYSGTDLWQSGGWIGGPGTLETSGTWIWTGGVGDGPGLTRSTGFTRIQGNVALEFDRRIQTHDGEWLSGEIWSRNRTQWLNTGAFEMRSQAGNAVFANWDNTPMPKITNTGTITKTAGDSSTTVGFALE
jgi:hypothetical protein